MGKTILSLALMAALSSASFSYASEAPNESVALASEDISKPEKPMSSVWDSIATIVHSPRTALDLQFSLEEKVLKNSRSTTKHNYIKVKASQHVDSRFTNLSIKPRSEGIDLLYRAVGENALWIQGEYYFPEDNQLDLTYQEVASFEWVFVLDKDIMTCIVFSDGKAIVNQIDFKAEIEPIDNKQESDEKVARLCIVPI